MAKIKKIQRTVDGVLRTEYPVTIHQAVVDVETDETLDVTLTNIKNDITNKANLKDAIQDSKIKDIESIISTMNPNQSAQLSVSGRKTISLPKNASNGGMQVKLEGLTAENLITNGNFANGTTGWGFGTNITETSVADSILSFIGTGALNSTQGNWIRRINITMFPQGHILYNIVTARSLMGAEFYVGIGYDSSDYNLTDQWGTYSHCGTDPSLSFPTYGANAGETVEMTNAMCFDLTEIFGAANEPTKEQCDIIFSDYFEGVKSFEPTGRVRSVDKNGINPTALYLTAPELRSNGLVKDEIRKGANGYEHVKLVGIGTINATEKITNGSFNGGSTGWNLHAAWAYGNNNIIGTFGVAGIQLYQNIPAVKVGGAIRLTYTVVDNTGDGKLMIAGPGVHPQSIVSTNAPLGDEISSTVGTKTYYFTPPKSGNRITFGLFLSGGTTGSITIDNISVKEVDASYLILEKSKFTELSDGTILYTLATPVITPISYGGILDSAENGTVYHEPIIADAGVYSDKMEILLTDYPIATIEEIIKHENGVDTYLNVASAVVASDGLSFTHPDLADGDLVLFTYAFDKESTNGNITATFYDSNVVKIDTVTGKAYKIEDVVTNGVLTRTLTEV